MLNEQKERLSSLMDGELSDAATCVDDISENEVLQQCWYRYHITRDVIRGKLHNCSLDINIAEKVAQAIAFDDLITQPTTKDIKSSKPTQLFWVKTKEIAFKVSQVGLAACVTLAIIAGVQYQQGQTNDNSYPVLNTIPVGISVAPVGGIPLEQNKTQELQQKSIDQHQYNKIRLLVQDYELQKRLNVQ